MTHNHVAMAQHSHHTKDHPSTTEVRAQQLRLRLRPVDMTMTQAHRHQHTKRPYNFGLLFVLGFLTDTPEHFHLVPRQLRYHRRHLQPAAVLLPGRLPRLSRR